MIGDSHFVQVIGDSEWTCQELDGQREEEIKVFWLDARGGEGGTYPLFRQVSVLDNPKIVTHNWGKISSKI